MLTPLADRVIIKPDDEVQKTAGGLYKPANLEPSDLLLGTVIAVGPGKVVNDHIIPMTLQVGDKVLYRRPMSDKVEDDGQKLVITNEDCCVAKRCI